MTMSFFPCWMEMLKVEKLDFFFVTESSKSFSFFTAFFSFFLRKGHVANFIDHQTQLHHLLEHLE
jgi:hypothetical protein